MNPPVGFTDPVSVASKVYKYHRFDPELVEQLVSIYRIMFPHNDVPNEFFTSMLSESSTTKQRNTKTWARFLSEGLKTLNGTRDSAWGHECCECLSGVIPAVQYLWKRVRARFRTTPC